MSTITALQIRDISTCDRLDCEGSQFSLADAAIGAQLIVVSVCSNTDEAAARRLFDLGFVPGTTVEMLRKAPMGDPAIFRVMGYEIALRKQQANCIKVVLA